MAPSVNVNVAVPPEPMTDVIPESETIFPIEVLVHPIRVDGPITRQWAGIRPTLTWNDLPRDARKSAKRPGIPENAPVYRMRCIRCRLDMWTRDHKKEDICETCEYIMIDEKHRLRGTHERARGGEFVNPFADVADTSPNVNPLVGGNTRLL